MWTRQFPFAPGPVVRRDLDVDVQAAVLDLALRQLHVLEHEKLRRRFELVDEAADVSVLARKRRAVGELDEVAVALRSWIPKSSRSTRRPHCCASCSIRRNVIRRAALMSGGRTSL